MSEFVILIATMHRIVHNWHDLPVKGSSNIDEYCPYAKSSILV
jgi:hypothetical protein